MTSLNRLQIAWRAAQDIGDGMVVDHIGYPHFFLYTASLAFPGLVLLLVLQRHGAFDTPRLKARAGAALET